LSCFCNFFEGGRRKKPVDYFFSSFIVKFRAYLCAADPTIPGACRMEGPADKEMKGEGYWFRVVTVANWL